MFDEAEARSRDLAVVWAAIALLLCGWGLRLLSDPPTPSRCDGPCDTSGLDAPARLLFGEPLDLNRASAADLEVLPGIGPARAGAIVAERERRAFESVDDLRAVSGVGPRTVAGLAGWVTVRAVRAMPAPGG
jgi:competence ComEA-like helix-hairpin-helix protein